MKIEVGAVASRVSRRRRVGIGDKTAQTPGRNAQTLPTHVGTHTHVFV